MSDESHDQERIDRRSYLTGSAATLGALSIGAGSVTAGDEKNGKNGEKNGAENGGNEPGDGDRTVITECTTITESGSYVLGDDLEADAGEACIVVRASDVLLDGRGHSISGPDGRGVEGVGVLAQPPGEESITDVTVTNLTLERLRTGVIFDDVTNGVIKDVTSEMTTIEGTSFVLIDADRNKLVDNDVERGGSGIFLTNSDENVLVGNETLDTFFPGIDLFESDENVLVGNAVTSADGLGLLVQSSDGNHLLQNTATLNAVGIYLLSANDNRLDLNTADENVAVGGGTGFTLAASDRNGGRGNTAADNPLGPISITGTDNAIEVNGTLYTGDPAPEPEIEVEVDAEAETDVEALEEGLTEARSEAVAFAEANRP